MFTACGKDEPTPIPVSESGTNFLMGYRWVQIENDYYGHNPVEPLNKMLIFHTDSTGVIIKNINDDWNSSSNRQTFRYRLMGTKAVMARTDTLDNGMMFTRVEQLTCPSSSGRLSWYNQMYRRIGYHKIDYVWRTDRFKPVPM